SSAQARETLCAWYRDQFAANGQRTSSSGFACVSGVRYALELDEGDCEKSALECDRPVREIEACLRALSRGPDEICRTGFPRACEGMRDCALSFHDFREPNIP